MWRRWARSSASRCEAAAYSAISAQYCNIGAVLKSIVGGEITQYTRLLEEAREHAIQRMVEHAQAKGADAVVMMRFDSSEIGSAMSEIVAYGTAVRLRPAS